MNELMWLVVFCNKAKSLFEKGYSVVFATLFGLNSKLIVKGHYTRVKVVVLSCLAYALSAVRSKLAYARPIFS